MTRNWYAERSRGSTYVRLSTIVGRTVIRALMASAVLAALLLHAGCRSGAGTAASEDKKPDEVPVETAIVQTRSMEAVITAQGVLTSAQGADARIAGAAPGRLTAVLVREGESVSRGQLLATVDNRPQQGQARSAAAAAKAAEQQAREADLAAQSAANDLSGSVQIAQLTVESAKADRDAALQQARTALQSAEIDYQKTKAGARPQEIAQADQAVKQAKANLDRASTEVERVQFLFEKGIDAKRQLDDARTALAVAQSAWESARQQASLLRQVRPEDLRAAELRVQAARQSLAQAQTSGNAKVAQADAGLRQARRNVVQVAVKRQDALAMHMLAASRRADVATALSTAATAEIRSPIRGVVTKRLLNPGDTTDVTIPILEIMQTGALNLLANVTAEDGRQVRAGMPAHITAADAPGRTFAGRVLNVGQVDPQTNLLSVRIAVSDTGSVLRTGAFATAEIVVRSDPHALVVPKQAILTREGNQVVLVAGSDGIAHQRPVLTGAEQDGLVEIRKGVTAGEKVIRLGNYEVSDGATIRDSASASAEPGAPEKAAER